MQLSSLFRHSVPLFLLTLGAFSVLAVSNPVNQSQLMNRYGEDIFKSFPLESSGSKSYTSFDCRGSLGKIIAPKGLHLGVCVFAEFQDGTALEMTLSDDRGRYFASRRISEPFRPQVSEIEWHMRLHAMMLNARKRFGQSIASSCTTYYSIPVPTQCTTLTKGGVTKIILQAANGLNYYFDGMRFHALGKKPLPALD